MVRSSGSAISKAGYDSAWATFRQINNTGIELGKMNNKHCLMALLVNALKKKSMRPYKFSLVYNHITHENNHVVILW